MDAMNILNKSRSEGNLISNYRMGGYLLIALGLINLRYQSGSNNVVANSLILVIPGAVLLFSTWISSISKVFDLGLTKVLTLGLGLALVAFAVFN